MASIEFETVCPYCGRHNNACGNDSDEMPEDGNVSLCWKCGKSAVFDFSQDTNVRKPTLEERIDWFSNPMWHKANRIWCIAKTPQEAAEMMNR